MYPQPFLSYATAPTPWLLLMAAQKSQETSRTWILLSLAGAECYCSQNSKTSGGSSYPLLATGIFLDTGSLLKKTGSMRGGLWPWVGIPHMSWNPWMWPTNVSSTELPHVWPGLLCYWSSKRSFPVHCTLDLPHAHLMWYHWTACSLSLPSSHMIPSDFLYFFPLQLRTQ